MHEVRISRHAVEMIIIVIMTILSPGSRNYLHSMLYIECANHHFIPQPSQVVCKSKKDRQETNKIKVVNSQSCNAIKHQAESTLQTEHPGIHRKPCAPCTRASRELTTISATTTTTTTTCAKHPAVPHHTHNHPKGPKLRSSRFAEQRPALHTSWRCPVLAARTLANKSK